MCGIQGYSPLPCADNRPVHRAYPFPGMCIFFNRIQAEHPAVAAAVLGIIMLSLQGKSFHQTGNKPPPIIVAYFLQENQVGSAFVYALDQSIEAPFDAGALLPDIELQNFQGVFP